MSELSLELRGIHKSFGGVEVLHGVDLRAAGGEVLALLGENGAGKSTLVKILAGDYTADSGEIVIDRTIHAALTPLSSRRLGVRVIHQEFQDAGSLTVAENISLGRWPGGRGFVSWKQVRRRAESVLEQMGVDIDPSASVGSLRVGERQVVEIARALADSARLLILDEPTAALSQQEVERLFSWVRQLRSQGVCLIYITHRLDEVTELSDRVQILRNGRVALVAPTRDTSRRAMVEAMVGRDIGEVSRPPGAEQGALGKVMIETRDLAVGRHVRGVDLQVRAGEVVCLYGKLGSGTTQVAEVCFGLRPSTSGTVTINGRQGSPRGPAQAIAAGVGFLPADRKREGVLMIRPVAENLAAASWPRMAKARVFISREAEGRAYGRWRDVLGIKAQRPRTQPISTLSGGNQQKVVLARWLERASNPLVLVEPTRGVDVGARVEIYASIRELAAHERAVLVVTSDYEEAVQLADRVLVMAKGRIIEEFSGDAVTTQDLLTAAGG